MMLPTDTLESILDDCAKMRGCWPCVNRSEDEFVDWLMDNKRDELISFALQFRTHCQERYGGIL